MKSLFQVAAGLDEALAERHWQYCFIGGIALQRWGQPRLTNDIDVTILADADEETIRVALDQEHAQPDSPVAGAREIAFFPPVTGG